MDERKRARIVDQRVRLIADLMAKGQWRTGTSHAELAQKWKKPIRYVYDRAIEAGRYLRLSVGSDRDAIVGAILGELEAICAEARLGGRWGEAVRAIDLRCRLLHLVDEPKHASPLTIQSARDVLAFVHAVLPEIEAQAQMPALVAKEPETSDNST